jgi:ribosomal protein S27E
LNRFVDITGETFGSRIVVGFSYQHPKSRNLYWDVVCNNCGNKSTVMGSRLRAGNGCQSCTNRVNGRKGLYSQSKGMPVYFIGCDDYMKVGSSFDPERRIKDLQVYNPYPLELIHVDNSIGEESGI